MFYPLACIHLAFSAYKVCTKINRNEALRSRSTINSERAHVSEYNGEQPLIVGRDHDSFWGAVFVR